MQSQSDWILALLQEYRRATLQTPVFVSDWDTLNDKAEYPEQLIRNALDIRYTSCGRGLFENGSFALDGLGGEEKLFSH